MVLKSIPFKESRLYKEVAADFEPLIEKEREARKKEQEARKKEQEARKKEQEARKKELRATVLNLVKKNFSVADISEILTLPESKVQSILDETGRI